MALIGRILTIATCLIILKEPVEDIKLEPEPTEIVVVEKRRKALTKTN